jgi:hypothetical protein
MYAGQYAWISLLFVAVVLFYLEKYTAKLEQPLMVEHIMSY